MISKGGKHGGGLWRFTHAVLQLSECSMRGRVADLVRYQGKRALELVHLRRLRRHFLRRDFLTSVNHLPSWGKPNMVFFAYPRKTHQSRLTSPSRGHRRGCPDLFFLHLQIPVATARRKRKTFHPADVCLNELRQLRISICFPSLCFRALSMRP